MISVDSFLKTQIWISGPSFLVRPKREWPIDPTDVNVMTFGDPELKESVLVNTLQVKQEYDFTSFFNHYSSWIDLKKGMAWIL